MNKISNKIKQARKERCLTRASLALLSGVNIRVIMKIEEGRDCSTRSLNKVLAALGMELAVKTKEE